MQYEIPFPDSPKLQFPHSDGWFGAHEARWASMFKQCDIASVLEIGAFEGRCTAWVAQQLQEQGGGHITVIDPWTAGQLRPNGVEFPFDMDEVYATFQANMDIIEKTCPDVVVEILRGNSAAMLLDLGDWMEFDLVYVDGAHDAANALRDMVLSFEYLRPGGIMVVDDYLWRLNCNPVQSPKMAIDFFTLAYAEHVVILPADTNAQVYLQKRS